MIYNGVELYVKDDKVGVLVSSGYGAGWSTWNLEYPTLAYDKRVIDYWLSKKDNWIFMFNSMHRTHEEEKEFEEFFESIGYKNLYFGGFKDCKLKFVDFNVPWTISEYDGSESLITLDDIPFTVFGNKVETSKYCPNCGALIEENSMNDILEENEPKLQMYIKKTEGRPNKYAYGEDWIEQALLMDDIQFDTEEEAIAWWEKYYGRKKFDS